MSNTENSQGGDKVRSFRMPRWAWVLATVSLAVNLLVVGAIAGKFLAHRHGHFFHGHRAFFKSLSEERRTELRNIMHEAREPVRPLWKKAREARKAVADAMRAEPYDEAELRKALTNLMEAEVAARSASEDMVLSIVTKLSAEERQWYAKKFERGKRRFPRHRGPHFKKEGP